MGRCSDALLLPHIHIWMGTAPARSLAQRLPKLQRCFPGFVGTTTDSPLNERKSRLLPATLLSPLSHLPERQVGLNLIISSPFKAWNYVASRSLHTRYVSQLAPAVNGAKRILFVDTLALVRKLESQGFTADQAEAITSAMTDVLNDSLENVAQSFVSKSDLQKNSMMHEAALSKLMADVKSSQEARISGVQRETEKVRTDIDKLRSEMRYEMDKVTAGQRLDLNLERGRIREELANQSAETSSLTNKLDMEIHALKTQLEASKYEVIKYCIGTIVSVYALGLALLRIFTKH